LSRAARAASLTLLLAALLAGALGVPTGADAADPGPTPVEVNPRNGEPPVNINEIEMEVMCPVCGTLLGLADSGQAQREKVFVGRLIEAGKSQGEIKDALVVEYGPSVLALPQDSGFDLSAYLVPIVGFLIAILALGFAVFRWRRAGGGPRGGRPAAASGLSDAEEKRLDADIGRYDL
jgi:cytochrome c-type biogenesis protein CcmH/NrfF